MNAYDAPTVHVGLPTAFDFATAWQAPSVPTAKPQPKPAQTQQADATPMPEDKWGMIGLFATRVTQAIEIERELKNLLERRQTLGRRVVDASKRRDETLAQQSTAEWIETEIKICEIFDTYGPFMQEREQTLNMLGVR